MIPNSATNLILLIEANHFPFTDFVFLNSATNTILLIEENIFPLNDFIILNSATNLILLIEANHFPFTDCVNLKTSPFFCVPHHYLWQRFAALRWLEVRKRLIFGLTKI